MTPKYTPELVSRAAEFIHSADALLITAGAGIGVDSGLPDFRGKDGFWKAYPALQESNISFHDIANPEMFTHSPMKAWGFYGHRLGLYRRTIPHNGFQLLKNWGVEMKYGSAVFTSNVDGQFQKAGFSNVYECHGSIHKLQCSVPCSDISWNADEFIPEIDISYCKLKNELPICDLCKEVARPNVLMFNDWGWNSSIYALRRLELDVWLKEAKNLVIIEIGAGIAIPSVRDFSERMYHKYKAKFIRINSTTASVPTNGSGIIDSVGLTTTALKGLTDIQLEL